MTTNGVVEQPVGEQRSIDLSSVLRDIQQRLELAHRRVHEAEIARAKVQGEWDLALRLSQGVQLTEGEE